MLNVDQQVIDARTLLLLLALAVLTGMLMGASLMAAYAAKKFEGLVDPEDSEEEKKTNGD